MNDNIKIDNTIAGSMNDNIKIDNIIAGSMIVYRILLSEAILTKIHKNKRRINKHHYMDSLTLLLYCSCLCCHSSTNKDPGYFVCLHKIAIVNDKDMPDIPQQYSLEKGLKL
jgi:hypothetical protein